MTLLYSDLLDSSTMTPAGDIRSGPNGFGRSLSPGCHAARRWMRGPTWQESVARRIERVHRAAYVDTIEDLAQRGGGRPDPDTVVGPASFDVARLAASGAACDAVKLVLAGRSRTAPGRSAAEDTMHLPTGRSVFAYSTTWPWRREWRSMNMISSES